MLLTIFITIVLIFSGLGVAFSLIIREKISSKSNAVHTVVFKANRLTA
jgi:hypothetical protein